jgi:hypothetical protein
MHEEQVDVAPDYDAVKWWLARTCKEHAVPLIFKLQTEPQKQNLGLSSSTTSITLRY